VGEDPLAGPPRVVHVDTFGNLVTNVREAALAGVQRVRAGARSITIRGTYAEVPPGEPVALVGSYGLLEVAVNGGDAAKALGLQRGAPIELLPA
jgi:hypothetical protein